LQLFRSLRVADRTEQRARALRGALALVPQGDSDRARVRSDRELARCRRRAYAPNAMSRAAWRFCDRPSRASDARTARRSLACGAPSVRGGFRAGDHHTDQCRRAAAVRNAGLQLALGSAALAADR